MSEMKKENLVVGAVPGVKKKAEKRIRKTVSELLIDNNDKNKIFPQLKQFIIEDVIKWAIKNGDAITVQLYSERRKFKTRAGKELPYLEDSDEKLILVQFRNRHFKKYPKDKIEKQKEVVYSEKEKEQLELEEMLKTFNKKMALGA